MKAVSVFFLLAMCIANAWSQSYSKKTEVQKFIAEVAQEKGLSKSDLVALFDKVEKDERVIQLMTNAPERKLNWGEYKAIFINEKRIHLGRVFLKENEKVLQKATRKYGVPAHIITAVLGIETYYGQMTGGHKVIRSLATLAFDYPPRQKFFMSELKHFLVLASQQNLDPLTLTGSYAGAMGQPQFMPSSYQHYAVDFDKNKTIDIWSDNVDSIGSIANYLYKHGWQTGMEVAHLINPENIDLYKKLSSNSLVPNTSVQQLRETGVDTEGLSSKQKYVPLVLTGVTPEEYWLGSKNFYVISRYNHSYLYTMAVYMLSQSIRS